MDESVNDASAVIHPSLSRFTGQAHPPVALAPTHAKKIPFQLLPIPIEDNDLPNRTSFCVETTGHVKLLDDTPSLLAKQFCPKILGKKQVKTTSLRSV